MSEPTKGPWEAEFSEMGGYDCMTSAWRVGPADIDLCRYGQKRCQFEFKSARAEADAHLISAAPDYHEGMENALLDAGELDGDNAGYVAITVEAWDMLKAAHAKAEGRK